MTATNAGVAPYVFLSYASRDRERALALADRLEAAGVRVWLDRQRIHGGTNWDAEIVAGIEHCAALLIACTAAALQSRNVQQEIRLAWRFERAYLPILLEPVEFPQQVQYFLEGWQWVEVLDAPETVWLPPLLKALVRLGVSLAPGAAPLPHALPSTPEAASPHPLTPSPVSGEGERDQVLRPVILPSPAAGEGLGVRETPVPAAAPGVRETRLAGRDAELATLRHAFAQAAAGAGRAVLVAGEPGIGKTRLAEDFGEEAAAQGALVLWGRCWEGDGAPPYLPWTQALGHFARAQEAATLHDRLGDAAADLAPLVPEVRALLPDLPPPPELPPEQARFRLFAAITAVLLRLARPQPLVLVLDDLHWADASSLLLLHYLVREFGAGRLLVLALYRDTDLERGHPLAQALAALRRERGVERLPLRGLDEAAVHHLLAQLLDQELGERGQALAVALWQETEGNPFFLEEIVRHLAESGGLVREGERWTSGAASIAELGLPEGVREVIGRRLSRLSPQAQALLASAAVVGREFELGVLVRLSGQEEEAVLAAVEEGVAAHLLLEGGSSRVGGVRYRFSHALVRQTLVEELRLPRRQRLHRQVAEALEGVHARNLEPQVAALAAHYRAAGAAADPEKALDYTERAGAAAARAFAWEEAVRHYEAALELLQDEDAAEPAAGAARLAREASLWLQLGEVLNSSGGQEPAETADRLRRATSAVERALVLYEQAQAATGAARAHLLLGRWASSTRLPLASADTPEVDMPTAWRHLAAAEALLQQAPEPALSVQVGILQATLARRQVQVGEARQAAERALAAAHALGDAGLAAEAEVSLGWARIGEGRLAEGLGLCEAAWQTANGLNRIGTASWATIMLSDSHSFLLGDVEAARHVLERQLEMLKRLASTSINSALLYHLASASHASGDRGASLAHAAAPDPAVAARFEALWGGDREPALHLWLLRLARLTEGGDRWYASLFAITTLAPVLDAGDAEAETLLQEALAVAVAGGHVPLELGARAELGRRHAETGRLDEAREHVARCRAIVAQGEDWRGQLGRVLLAEAALLAAEACNRAVPRSDAAGEDAPALPGSVAEPRAAGLQMAGAAAPHAPDATDGDWQTLLEQALATFVRYGLTWDEAEARQVWGRALARAGQADAAREQFAAALAVYARIEAGNGWRDRVLAQMADLAQS